MENQEKLNQAEQEDFLLLAEYQLRLNYWKQEIEKWEKEIEEQCLKQNGR